MKRLFLAALALALTLPGCAGLGSSALNTAASVGAATADAAGYKPPAPLRGTTIDERAGIALLTGYDAFLFVIDTMDLAGALPPSSAKVQRLAGLIEKTTAALRTAAMARRLGNEATFKQALADAKATYALAQQTLGSN